MKKAIELIKESEVYKQVIKDACGGVMYNVANRDKYDDLEIIALWETMPEGEKAGADGIIKGAMNFLTS